MSRDPQMLKMIKKTIQGATPFSTRLERVVRGEIVAWNTTAKAGYVSYIDPETSIKRQQLVSVKQVPNIHGLKFRNATFEPLGMGVKVDLCLSRCIETEADLVVRVSPVETP